METHNIMSFKAMLLLLLFSVVLAKGDLDPSTILKTIVSGDETIDCVDKYKQPAFNHPLLKNHTLRSKPSSYPVGSNSRVSAKLTQKWHESGEFCPKGTVPILRKPAKSTTSNDNPASINNSNPYFLNVGPGGSQEEPVLYTYWTVGGETKGCMNMDCPGFVLKTEKYGLGAKITPISKYHGEQHSYNIKIYKFTSDLSSNLPASVSEKAAATEFDTGDWWLNNEDEVIGYWPKGLFGRLSETGELVEWGGKSTKNYAHTLVEMGSGHFAYEGYGGAAFISNMEYADERLYWIKAPAAGQVQTLASETDCYTINLPEYDKDIVGTHLYYGGDGRACSNYD
ncbi:hypothetical protein LINPERPRIM_LOCUS26982 [Linum perenne]